MCSHTFLFLSGRVLCSSSTVWPHSIFPPSSLASSMKYLTLSKWSLLTKAPVVVSADVGSPTFNFLNEITRYSALPLWSTTSVLFYLHWLHVTETSVKMEASLISTFCPAIHNQPKHKTKKLFCVRDYSYRYTTSLWLAKLQILSPYV